MIHVWLNRFRLNLANNDSLIQFSILGVLAGLSTALVSLGFRFLIEWPPTLWLPNRDSEGYESLPVWAHFALPLGGAIIIGLVLRNFSKENLRTGVPHVITHLHAHDGHMPMKNALIQFFGGAFAIITGQSAGREGPAIHLGAAASSFLGQKLKLPNNSIRILVGCGTAAAIAASFNTPIAGVIIAMEVVMMEYSIAGFTPVILSALTATTVTRAVYGSQATFIVPTAQMASLWELPYIALLGLLIGGCAAMFIMVLKMGISLSERPILQRMALAGLVTGCCALIAPQIMGTGYDSVNAMLSGDIALVVMAAMIGTKLIASAFSCGLGMPIGIIGPCLYIGACIGGVMAAMGSSIFPELATGGSFYVMIGMGAMMGAVLNAPLAALMTVLELTQNPTIIFPAMLAISIASITNSEIFKQRSAHQTVIQHLKLFLPTDPVSLGLQRSSVATLMQRNIHMTKGSVSSEDAKILLTKPHHAYVITADDGLDMRLIYRADLGEKLENAINENPDGAISLLDICTVSHSIIKIHIQATLREALYSMNEHDAEAVFVTGYISGSFPDYGIVTRKDIERYNNTPQK
jgi:CIC family chloride channel protein